MAGLAQRLKTWLGPSKRDLMAQIAHLQDMNTKFGSKAVSAGTKMGYGDFKYDPNSALHGADKYKIFDKMTADPHVKGLLLDKALALVTAEWEVKAASDSPKDIEIAEFCAANLLRQPSEKFGHEYWTQTSWKAQRLPEILTMLDNGFSMFVSTWKRVGTNVVYDRLQWIEPWTINGTQPWEIDDQDNIIAINRRLTTPQQQYLTDERIEADRLKLYVWDMKGARFEGSSFIRAMYGAWYRKEFMQRMAAIWAQKVGAPIPIGHYPQGWNPTDISRFRTFVMAMRGEAPAEAFGMFPVGADGSTADVKYAGAETGEVDRMGALIQSENQEIHQGGRDSGAMLGETAVGSRALGDSKGRSEIKLTQALAEMVSEWENHGVGNLSGTLEDLVNRNYTVKAYPELVCSKIDPFQDFAETLEAWKAGIIPKHEDARRQICEGTLGMNLPDEAYEVEEPPPMIPGQLPPGAAPAGEQVGDTEDEDEDGIEASLASVSEFRERIMPMLAPAKEGAPAKGRRFPTKLEEKLLDLPKIDNCCRIGERDLLTELRGVRRVMVDELMGRLRDGKITARNLESQRRSAFKGGRKARNSLKRRLLEVGDQGMKHVEEELSRG